MGKHLILVFRCFRKLFKLHVYFHCLECKLSLTLVSYIRQLWKADEFIVMKLT